MNEITSPFIKAVAEKLIDQLKEGVAPWQTPWQAGEPGSAMPFNPVTGNRYKGINALQLMSEGHDDQRWMTYKQAASVGAQVRIGEKGTPIQYWKFTEDRILTDGDDQPVLGADGKPAKHTVKLERPSLYTSTVFNATQIDGLPAQQRDKEQNWSSFERAEAILKASGASIHHGERDKAFYRPSTDTIHLPDKEQFPTADRYYATALHELGHWTGHPSRLDRDLAHPFGSEGYAREELRAEIASMMLGDELGVGHDPGQHAAYVGSWIKAIRDDPLEIFRAASDAEKIQAHVLGIEQTQTLENAEAQQVASFIVANQRLPHEEARNNVLSAEPKLISLLADEAKMQALDARVTALIQGINQSYIDEARVTIASLSKSGEPERHPAVPDADLDDAQMVAEFIEANINSGRESLEANASSAAPQLKAILADSRRMKSLEAQVDQLLHNLNRAQVEETRTIVAVALDDMSLASGKEVNKRATENYNVKAGETASLGTRALQLTTSEYEVAEARRANDFAAVSTRAFGFPLPGDWTGRTRVEEPNTENSRTDLERLDGNNQGWSVFAGRADNTETLLSSGMSEGDAKNLASRLSLIAAHAEENEFEKAAKLAKIREDAVLDDPNSTAEDVAAAREARKDAELNATRNDADLLRRIAEREKVQSTADAKPAPPGALTYLNVAYQDREEAKALGAKWDRREQAWYVPPGVDPAPFNKYAVQQHHPKSEQLPDGSGAQTAPTREAASREYLAVPYADRKAAKAAGAVWDRDACSWYAGQGADMDALARWKPGRTTVNQLPSMTPREEFADVLRAAGCVVSGEHPIMDGQKHRIGVAGEQQRQSGGSGFYVGHLDGHPAGYVKNNKTGVDVLWKSKSYKLDQGQKAQLRSLAAGRLQDRSVEQARLQQQAAERVVQQLAELVPVTRPTPYMQSKGLEPLPGAYTDSSGKTTYIPGVDADGKQWTTQYIQANGSKRFAKDTRKTGCFHAVGGIDALAKAPALVIAEGYATASSLASSLGHATVAAFDAGNLPVVAGALRAKFPDKPVIIAGDNDLHRKSVSGINPGRNKAQEAARISNGRVLLPIFAPGEVTQSPAQFTDFNDLANRSKLGREGLDRQVRTAVTAEIQKHQAAERLMQEHTLQQRHALKIG